MKFCFISSKEVCHKHTAVVKLPLPPGVAHILDDVTVERAFFRVAFPFCASLASPSNSSSSRHQPDSAPTSNGHLLASESPTKMKPVLTFGRFCLRQSPHQSLLRLSPRNRSLTTKRSFGRSWQNPFSAPPKRYGLIFAAAVGLSPAVFVQLSEKDNGGTEHTAEGRMLEASRDEIRKAVGDDVHGLRRVRDNIILCLDLYIWEPFCTGFRFLHLVFIFVPVILAVPAIWIGGRDKERSNERSGTLWWYWFLVKSMERAGPAFIKVNDSPVVYRQR